jgi:ferric-dicitrate binding protein FerR (iron transport regulator)
MLDFRFYENYGFRDFIEDEEFRLWVKHPNPKRNQFWKDYINHYPLQKEIVSEAKAFLLNTKAYFDLNNKSEDEINIGLAQLLAKKERNNLPKQPSTVATKTPIKRLSYQMLAIAASILLLIGFAAIYQYQQNQNIYKTSYAEWKTISLPDGSIVNLNANSELKIAEDWSDNTTRKVWLKGEAYFKVERKPATGSKFQVITEDLTIEVLGTAFNVQKRAAQTEVFLEEGSIKLDIEGEETFMQPGDFASYSQKKKEMKLENKVKQTALTSWKDGVLELGNTSIAKVFDKIKEIYGVSVEVADTSILSIERTIALPMKDLDMVIPMLELTLEVDISKKGNTLIVEQN